MSIRAFLEGLLSASLSVRFLNMGLRPHKKSGDRSGERALVAVNDCSGMFTVGRFNSPLGRMGTY